MAVHLWLMHQKVKLDMCYDLFFRQRGTRSECFRMLRRDLESKWGTGAFNCRFLEANFLLISLRCSKVGSEEEKHNKAVLETAENKKQIGRKKD